MNIVIKYIYLIGIPLFLTFTSSSVESTMNATAEFGGWQKLGTQSVSEGASYDVLDVNAEKGNFTRLKLKVQKTSVYLMSIKVMYEDGTSENHMIRRRLEKGDATRSFDLIGHFRIIQKIMFTYRSGSVSKGGAQLTVLAKS